MDTFLAALEANEADDVSPKGMIGAVNTVRLENGFEQFIPYL